MKNTPYFNWASLLEESFTERFRREYINKNTLYGCIRDIWEVFNLFYPFPVCHVMEYLEPHVTVEFRKHKNLNLCGMINKKAPPDKSTIFINNGNPRITQLFSLYHEIMHWFFHPPLKTHCNIMGGGVQGIEDYHANEGAAEMLVPYRVFIPWAADEINSIDLNDAKAIQAIKNKAVNYFNVSPTIINYRFEGLKYELQQYMDGVDLYKINFMSKTQQTAKGIKVNSLNDMEIISMYRYCA
jgi:Zn-dependent peptidase ImmA (M78 family)